MGIEFVVGRAEDGIGRLWKGDSVRLAGTQIHDLDLTEATLTLLCHEVVGEENDALDPHWLPVRDDFRPILRVRVCDGRADDAIVDAGVVGEEVKPAATMIPVVLVTLFAGQQETGGRGRVAGGDHTLFRGRLAASPLRERSMFTS